MVDPASIKYTLIYEHINQEMGVDQIITEQLSIYLTRHLLYIDLEKKQGLGRTIMKSLETKNSLKVFTVMTNSELGMCLF